MLFSLFSGLGLGKFNSSRHLAKDGTPPSTLLGLSKEALSVNVATGNLTISTTDFAFAAPGLDNILQRQYNSQAAQGWKLAAIDRLVNCEPNAQSIDYEHADGHITTFQPVQSTGSGEYEAWWSEVGRVTLKQTESKWQLTIPSTGTQKTFTENGLLETQTSWDNGQLVYARDEAQRLTNVTDSAGNVLSLEYITGEESETHIYLKYNNVIYSYYTLDNHQRLRQIILPLADNQQYAIQFAYDGDSQRITNIKQDDGTTLAVTYERIDDLDLYKVKTIGSQTAHAWTLQYAADTTTITAPEGESEQWYYVTNTARLITHERYARQTANQIRVQLMYRTQYAYGAHEYIQSLIEHDGTQNTFAYNENTGWREEEFVIPAGSDLIKKTTTQRSEVGQPTTITTEVRQHSTNISLSTTETLIYDEAKPYQLRFVVDAKGYVTEKRYENNQCSEILTYFTEPYTGDRNLTSLSTWASNVSTTQIAVEKFAYHVNGEVKQRQLYTANAPGNTRVWDYISNEFGLVTQTTEPAAPEATRPVTQAGYDTLQRLTMSTNAVNRTTTIAHQSATETTPYTQTTTLPTNAKKIAEFTATGSLGKEQTIVEAEDINRYQTFAQNNNDQMTSTTDHLGRTTVQLYDDMGRDAGIVDALGYATLIYRDHRGRETHRQQLSTSIVSSAAELTSLSKQQVRERLQNLLSQRTIQRNEEDTEGWTVYDAADRPLYKISNQGAVKEFRYSLFKDPEFILSYANRINVSQLSDTPTAADILSQLASDPMRDQFTRQWLDADGRKIAQLIRLTPTEYRLIKWDHFHNGLVVRSREYATKLLIEDPFSVKLEDLTSNTSADDITTYTYYNTQEEVIGTINGENIFTETERNNRGDAVKITRYYTKVTVTDPPQAFANLDRAVHTKDWITYQTFDNLHRVTQRIHPNGRKETFEYQDSTTPIKHLIEDIPLSSESRQKHARGETLQVNALGEVKTQLLPDGVDELYVTGNEDQAWTIFGKNTERDEAGREALTEMRFMRDLEDTRTHKEINYFDARNQPRFHIGALGELIEKTFDNRGNVLTEYQYKTLVPAEKLSTLTGGVLTEELHHYFELLRGAEDRLTQHYYEGARRIATLHANNQWIFYQQDAFGNLIHTAEQLTATEWRITIRQFDARNIEIDKKQMGVRVQTSAKDFRTFRKALFSAQLPNYQVIEERKVSHVSPDVFGRAAETQDGNGVKTHHTFDKANRLTEKTCQNVLLEGYEYDAHDQITKDKEADGYLLHDFDTINRIHTLTPVQIDEDGNETVFPSTKLHLDAFDQTVIEDKSGVQTRFEYHAYGQYAWKVYANGQAENYHYLVGGKHRATEFSGSHTIHHDIDLSYRRINSLLYNANNSAIEYYDNPRTLNAFGEVEFEAFRDRSDVLPADALKTIEFQHDYNKRGQRNFTIQDPNGAKRLTNFNRRLDGVVLQEDISNGNVKGLEPARLQDYGVDSFNRPTTTIVDPIPAKKQVRTNDDHLQIKSSNTYDASDIPIATTDANNLTSYIIRAGHGRSQLNIDPQGRGTYTEKNSAGKLILRKRFVHTFTVAEIQNIQQSSYSENLSTILTSGHYNNAQDLVQQWLYDKRDVLRYEISPGGRVTEHNYNNAYQKNCITNYKQRITVDNNQPYTLKTLTAAITTNPAEDVNTYFVLDSKGLPEYIIDAEGYLTYQKHDAYDNIQETTRYADKIPAGTDYAGITLAQAKQYAAEREINLKNRTELKFYTAHENDKDQHLLRFTVNSLGYVTQYHYDPYNNCTHEITYHEPGSIQEFRSFTYLQMQAWCDAYDNDLMRYQSTDRTVFDGLNRKTAAIDSENKAFTYEPDILGNLLKSTDRNGNVWLDEVDRAGRKIKTLQPLRDVTHITVNPETKKLEATRTRIEVATGLKPDGVGQIIETTEALGLSDERIHQHDFNASREQQTNTLKNARFYNPDKDIAPKEGASRDTFEETADLSETTTTNAFGWPVIIIHRDGARTYHVYGNDHDETSGKAEVLYTVLPDGAVIGNEHDAFGNIIAVTKYATRIKDFDAANYPHGLTVDDIEGKNGKEALLVKDAINDRTIRYSFDRLQHKLSETYPEVVSANGNNQKKPDNDERFYKHQLQKNYQYDAFSNKLSTERKTNPFAPKQPTRFRYYDNKGRKVAKINALGYLSEYLYDSQDNNTYEIRYENPCTTYDANSYVQPARHEKDRETYWGYDSKNRKIVTQEMHVRYYDQHLQQDIKQLPTLSTEQVGMRLSCVFYDAQDNPIITVRYITQGSNDKTPKKILSLEVNLHSPINKIFARIGTLRKSYKAGTHEPQTFIPLIGYEHDSHGNTVVDRVYAQSIDATAYATFYQNVFDSLLTAPYDLAKRDALIQEANALATPEKLNSLKDDTRDRITLRQFDNADNAIAETGPSGLTQYTSYTKVPKQAAKRWWFDKVWDTNLRDRLQEPTLKEQPWVVLAKYSEAGLQLRLERWAGEEHHVERYAYNMFKERTHRGSEDENSEAQWQEIWIHDPLGRIQRTNSGDGVWKYTLYQPGVKEPSLIITSPTVDLSSERANDLRWVLNQPADKIRQLWTFFDDEGRITERLSPAYSVAKPAPNIALTAGEQTDNALIEDFGKYAVVWNRPANFGTRARLLIRVYQPEDNTNHIHQSNTANEDEWLDLPVITTATHMGVNLTEVTADYYNYKVELYHLDDPEPYSTGEGFIALRTPNTEKSKHIVPTVDTNISSTTIRISGNTKDEKTGEMTGVRMFSNKKVGEEETPHFLGVTPDELHPGEYLVEGRGLSRGVYTSIGKAVIDTPIGNRYVPEPPPIADPEGNFAENITFITEVTTHASLQVDVVVTEEMWTPSPDDPSFLPCYDPDDPHDNHEERGCEPPLWQEGDTPPEELAEVYRHIATVTIDVTGIPQHPEGAVIAALSLRCESGKTITLTEQVFPSKNMKTGALFSKENKSYTFLSPDNYVKLNATDEDGKTIPIYAQVIWKENNQATLILQVVVEEFVKADPEEVWQEDAENPIPLTYPPGSVLDYPVAVERVVLEGYTTTNGFKNLADIKKQVAADKFFPLYQKAPNSQAVVVNGKQQKTDKLFVTNYPQRTLYMPQTLLKAKSSSPYDTPIAVRVAKQSESFASLGTIALNTIANPLYQTADISTLSTVNSTLNATALEVQAVAPTKLAEAFPAPTEANALNTKPYNSTQGANEPFNPDPNPIKEFYFSDVWVNYIYYNHLGNYNNDIRFRNYASLPAEVNSALIQGKGVVKLRGHWYGTSEDQQVEVNLVFAHDKNGEVTYYYWNNNKLLIPSEVEITVVVNNIKYLIYKGLGENHYYNKSELPDILGMPHHGLYGFTTTYPEIKTTYVEAYKKSDKSLITNLPVLPPYSTEYIHHRIEIPAEVKPAENYFVPRGNEQPANPIVSEYCSDLYVIYAFSVMHDFSDAICTLEVGLNNLKSLPNYLKVYLSKGDAQVLLSGYFHRQNEPLTYSLTKLANGNGNYISAEVIYAALSIPRPLDELFIVTDITVKIPVKEGYPAYFIYKGIGDEWISEDLRIPHEIYPHHSFYAFRTARPPEQVVSVQVIDKISKQIKATLPILPPIQDANYYYLDLPASLNPKECEYQPVGPSLVQPHPILQTDITMLGYIKEQITVAESYWKVHSYISEQMYWTRYDKKWSDAWSGKKQRWEGVNRIQIICPHSQDIWGGQLKFTIKYTLDSYNGNQPASYTHNQLVDDVAGIYGFNLYSPYTSSKNAAARIRSIDAVKIARIVDGKEVVVYDSGPKGIQYLLYLTPLPIETADSKPIHQLEFYYRAKNDGNVGLWQSLPLTLTKDAAYLDSNTVPIGNYGYKLRALDADGKIIDLNKIANNEMGVDGWVCGDFKVTRHVGVEVPKANTTQSVIQPGEKFKSDRDGNVIEHTGLRNDVNRFDINHDGKVTLAEGPEITTVLPEPHLDTPPPAAKDNKAEPHNIPATKKYVAHPIEVLGTIKPELNVTFMHPKLVHNGLYKNKKNNNAAHLKIKLQGLCKLPFDEYQLEIIWRTASGEERHHNFSWMPKEKDHRIHQDKYKCRITEKGYEETVQIPLHIIQDLEKNACFDVPQNGVTWNLHGLNQGTWHNIVEYAPAAHYERKEQSANKKEAETKQSLTTSPVQVVLFKTDKFHKVEQFEYKTASGKTAHAAIQRTCKKRGFYRVYLPVTTDTNNSYIGFVDANTVKKVPESLLKKSKPTTRTFHDANGDAIAQQSPMGKMTQTVNDGAGNPNLLYNNDYLQQLKQPNEFSETIKTENAQGKITETPRAAKSGYIEAVISPDGEKTKHLRNAQGSLLEIEDPLGGKTYMQPAGLDGRNLADRDADGIVTTYQYQPHTGKLTRTTYADTTYNEILRNYWATETGGQDRAKVPYVVEHDNTQQPTSRTSYVTAEHNHGKDENGELIPGQSIRYGYLTDGRLFQMLDTVRNVLVEMHPEIGGEVARKRVFTEHGITQDLISTYNLLGWVEGQSDTDFVMVMYYDEDGNKRELLIDCRNPETEELQHDEQVFTFANDNTTVTARASRNAEGKLEWNTNTHNTSVAETINGQKLSLTFFRRYPGKAGQYVKETYAYSPRGLLAAIERSDDTSAHYDQDAAGRATGDVSKDYHGNDSSISSQSTQNTLTPAGRLAHSEQHSSKSSSTYVRQNLSDSRAEDGTLKKMQIETFNEQHVINDVRTDHVLFEQPQDSLVTNTQTIEDVGVTTATGRTYYGSTGERLKYVPAPSLHGRKDFVATFLKDIHSVKEFGDDTGQATRVVYSFKDAKGQEVARFERDKNRRDWPSQGMWTFDMSNRSSLAAPIQNLPLMQTVQEGTTLTELANGNQELLWLLEEANPAWGATTSLPAGTQIVIPGAQDRFNAKNHGWSADVASMIGGALPEAPLPYIPHPDREGGMKQYFPMMVGTAISISLMIAFPVGSLAASTTMLQFAGMMAKGAAMYMASNAASQIAAKQIGLTDQGFDFKAMLESGAMGAAMTFGQAGATAIGLEMVGVKSVEALADAAMWKQAFVSMTNAATTQIVQSGFNGFDLRSIISNVVASGVTETMLSQSGFNKKDYGSNLENAVGYTVDSLGAGFAQAALASVISGQPMDAAAVSMNALAQLVTKLGMQAVSSLQEDTKSSVAPVPEKEAEEANYTSSQQAAQQLRKNQVEAPGQTVTPQTDEAGRNESKQPAVSKPPATKKVNDSKLKDLQYEKRTQEQQRDFAKGNEHVKKSHVSLSPQSKDFVGPMQELIGPLPEQLGFEEISGPPESTLADKFYNFRKAQWDWFPNEEADAFIRTVNKLSRDPEVVITFIPAVGAVGKVAKAAGTTWKWISSKSSVETVPSPKQELQLKTHEFQVTHEMTMGKKEFRRLVENVKSNGIQEPIKYVEHMGKKYVVDGHHRLAAARQLELQNIPVEKVELPFRGYKAPDDLFDYNIRPN